MSRSGQQRAAFLEGVQGFWRTAGNSEGGDCGWLCDGGVIQRPNGIHFPETVGDSRDSTNAQPVLDIL